MSEFSDSESNWFGTEFLPIRARFGKHYCISCGNLLMLEKKHLEKKSENVKRVYRFSCSKCKKDISPMSQLSYENNEKRLNKLYKKLLGIVKAEQIKKVWVDQSDNILDYMIELENINKIMFIVNIEELEFRIPCSRTKKLKNFYEKPTIFKKCKDTKGEIKKLKMEVKNNG